MPQFQTIEQAFEWFLEEVYPSLPTEQKTTTLRATKSIYYKGERKVSTKKMRTILEQFCDYQVMHDIKRKNDC